MKRRQKGLTLIELMVTLAVAIVILAIGIPAFTTMSARDISAATVNGVVTALQQARVEAVSRGERVAVCAITASTPCASTAVPDCDETDWRCGWAVVRAVAPADPVRVFPAPRGQVAISIAGQVPVLFTSQGETELPVTVPGTAATVTINTFPSSDHSDLSTVIRSVEVNVNRVGQINSETKK